MILVAFVLVLVATVMLIIGTFFDAGTAYIWISIGACLATFAVLAASYLSRRGGGDVAAARPQPLSGGQGGTAGPATAPSAPAEQPATAASGGTVTTTRDEPEADVAEPEDATVTIVAESAPPAAEVPTEEPAEPADAPVASAEPAWPDAPAEEPAAEEPAAEESAAEEPAIAEPAIEEPAAEEPPAPEEPAAAPAASAEPAASPEAPPARKVVRRAGGAGGAKKVVRRAAPGEGQRTVRRVVRRAPGAPAAARSGTRGQRARAVLSEVKGLGPAKQEALLREFGSLERMATASVEEIAAIREVGAETAAAIKAKLESR